MQNCEIDRNSQEQWTDNKDIFLKVTRIAKKI